MIVQGQAELLEPVLAIRPGGGLAHLLDRRDQEGDQDGDDGDDDQKLDEREARMHTCLSTHRHALQGEE
jgi:hypothetical protein